MEKSNCFKSRAEKLVDSLETFSDSDLIRLITDLAVEVAAEARLVALEEGAKECDRLAGNDKDFDRHVRKAAGICALEIRALKESPCQD